MSNLVRRIVRHYGAIWAGSILVTGLCVAFWSAAAAGPRPLVCVLVPHFKDEYWLSVGYGLEQQAERLGLDLLFYEAGGYRARSRQIGQIDTCLEQGVDAILIGAVTSDHADLIAAIEQAALRTPVFGLVNELHAETLSGRIGVDWQDMGQAVGHHLAKLHPQGSPAKTAILISGPSEAGWTGPLEAGLRNGLSGSEVTILEVFGADTGLSQQLAQVETALERYPDADYLIGSAPAIEAAIGTLMHSDNPKPPGLISTYISHTVIRGLMNGKVLAAPFDDPTEQGTMALDQVVAVLTSGEREGLIGPDIVLLTRSDAELTKILISPAEYFPNIQ